MQRAFDPDDGDFFVKLPDLSGLRAANCGIKRAFIDPIPNQVADVRRILVDFPADVILADQVFAGAEAVHALGGPPWSMLGVSALTLSIDHGAVQHNAATKLRRCWGGCATGCSTR
jgi:hypothetical protein